MTNLTHSASDLFALAIHGESDLCPSVYKPLVLLGKATGTPRQAMACLAQLETRADWQFLDIELTCPPAEILPQFTTFRTKNSVYRQVEQEKANES